MSYLFEESFSDLYKNLYTELEYLAEELENVKATTSEEFQKKQSWVQAFAQDIKAVKNMTADRIEQEENL